MPIGVTAFPAFLTDQRNETHVCEILLFELAFIDAEDANQFLRSLIGPDGDHHAPSDLQLIHQGLGDIWRTG